MPKTTTTPARRPAEQRITELEALTERIERILAEVKALLRSVTDKATTK